MMNTGWKTVRVFISSTFLDMQAERDWLVRFVFPRLREELLPHHIHLVDIDLRWGVTSEQDSQEACRGIIDECYPRFMCMLGERYGWVPPDKEISITADEIHYGVLDLKGKDRGYAYFYFRAETATAAMVEAYPGELREPPGSDKGRKLAELKQAIRAAGLNPFIYPAHWDKDSHRLTGLKMFGDRVYNDLLYSIKSDPGLSACFQVETSVQLDEFAEERTSMEAFVEEHCRGFVLGSRQAVLNELLTHTGTSSGNGYLCLTGAPGSGKSALLAYLSRHPALQSSSILLISHFIGASPGSTDVRRTLRQLCYELKAGYPGITAEIPNGIDELRSAFQNFLQQASASRRVVVLLDGINQFNPGPYSAGLHWLPAELPANTRFIISSLEGDDLDEIRNYLGSLQIIKLQPLTLVDGEAIIQQFYERYRKNLDPLQRAGLLKKASAETPLYLLAALEELRTLGTYEDITQRIDALPSSTFELFTWILTRLENDDGFRNKAGQRIGSQLVANFSALMGASRHGLSQRELCDLLAPGDPQGNIAALLYLLRPFLMQRGELIDFYHGQFRLAAQAAGRQKESQLPAAHTILADYFRQRANPGGTVQWELDPRVLQELLFHLASGKRMAELEELLSQLSYLSARVETGGIHDLIADYTLVGKSLPSVLEKWQAFLQKHAGRLSQYPGMLVALVNHEGFPEAFAQVAAGQWAHAWLRTRAEQLPAGETKASSELIAHVIGILEFPSPVNLVIASEREVAFCIERLGAVSIFDMKTMKKTELVFSISRDRPLAMACSPDATNLSIFYDTGRAELFRTTIGQNGLPVRLERVAEFRYYLPASSDPVVVWHQGAFWYQNDAGTLNSISVDNTAVVQESLPGGLQGELSAFIHLEGTRLVALRQDMDTILLAPGAVPLRLNQTDVVGACSCGEKMAAVAFSNGSLSVIGISGSLEIQDQVQAGMVFGALGWDGSRFIWLSYGGGMKSWAPGEVAPQSLQDNQVIFPKAHFIIPRMWLSRSDGSMWLSSTHSLVKFKLSNRNEPSTSSSTGLGRMEEILGGPVWRAIFKREKDLLLAEKQANRETQLMLDTARAFCAVDGKGFLFAASASETGIVVNLHTSNSTSLRGCPPGINGVVGEPLGGCWLTDRNGNIYFAHASGSLHKVAQVDLDTVHGSHLFDCNNVVVWVGHTFQYFPGSGSESTRSFVFFKKIPGEHPRLVRLGEQHRHPKEGLCVMAGFDGISGRLVTMWEFPVDGISTYKLRIGPVQDFARWQFQELSITGIGPLKFLDADLSADGKWLGVLNAAGEMSCVSVSDGCVRAVLSGSAPFTDLAPGASGPEFWLVEAHSRIYRCNLEERST